MPVGQFPGNAFGLHDMHGNVQEWVEDGYHDSYRLLFIIHAPTDGTAWEEKGSDHHVNRGGAWNLAPAGARSAYRFLSRSSGNSTLGFRVARTL